MNPGQVRNTAGAAVAFGTLGTITVNIPVNTNKPTATLQASDLTTGGGTDYTFTVTYDDDNGLLTSSFDNSDIQVTSLGGFSQAATFVSSTPGTGNQQIATYQITPTSGTWSGSNNSTYTVALWAGQVLDLSGNDALASTLGTFTINIPTPDTTPPVATVVSYIVTPGAATLSIRVSYTDDTSVSVATIKASTLSVTTPGADTLTATYASVSTDSDGASRVATYTLSAPAALGIPPTAGLTSSAPSRTL